MIKTEVMVINGKNFTRTYSDEGKRLLQVETGILYDEAVDIEGAPYTYTESDEEIEMTAEEALELILGGEVE